MIKLVIDIETRAGSADDAEEWMRREWNPNPNWTPETIGKRYLEALEKKRARLALMDQAPICVIQTLVAGAQSPVLLHTFGKKAGIANVYEEVFNDEADLLKSFRDTLDSYEGMGGGVEFIGHNIRAFDLPKLRFRMLKHQIRLPRALVGYAEIYDIMEQFSRGFMVSAESKFVALSDVLDWLGLDNHKTLMSGEQVGAALERGDYGTILNYAALDVMAEEKVAGLMRGGWNE